ncbi:MAG: hypothetical protein AAGF73_11660 [Actinomycetota bacterium]
MRLHIYLAGLDPNGQAVAALADEFEDDDPHIEMERRGGNGVLEIDVEPDAGIYREPQLDRLRRRVEGSADVAVTAFGPTPYVSMARIAARTDKSPQSIFQHARGERGPGGFPAPLNPGDRGPVWEWADVHAWITHTDNNINIIETEATLIEVAAVALIGKYNAGLRSTHTLDTIGQKR